jgi:hypothetical protein
VAKPHNFFTNTSSITNLFSLTQSEILVVLTTKVLELARLHFQRFSKIKKMSGVLVEPWESLDVVLHESHSRDNPDDVDNLLNNRREFEIRVQYTYHE